MNPLRMLTAGAMLALAGCNEIPQDAPKPFAARQDVQLYDGNLFKGDKVQFEKSLAARARNENEYLRMGGAATK